MLPAPASRSICRASSTPRPTTAGTVRSTETVIVAPAPGSALVPGAGSQARTTPNPSSTARYSASTANPSLLSALVASSWPMPTTGGTVLPPQSSLS